ncbi:hypothetical protein ARMSODRAFT_978360 [Armillaria solidipes]|uniref:Uncharacterized protein n=1 Tax=Armillaria solidipes TaxID=1076256 RepID=A0A2H3B2Z3_9AGAR|nr:hypothetical protein ARMSODRAFT_978360 [Armillaria solidipes]
MHKASSSTSDDWPRPHYHGSIFHHWHTFISTLLELMVQKLQSRIGHRELARDNHGVLGKPSNITVYGDKRKVLLLGGIVEPAVAEEVQVGNIVPVDNHESMGMSVLLAKEEGKIQNRVRHYHSEQTDECWLHHNLESYVPAGVFTQYCHCTVSSFTLFIFDSKW